MSKYISKSEKIYDGTSIKEIIVGNGSDLRIQSVGYGTYKLVGKMAKDAEYKPLPLIKMGYEFDSKETITDDWIYASDVSGIYSITLQNISGVNSVYVSIME